MGIAFVNIGFWA